MKEISNEELLDDALKDQIPEAQESLPDNDDTHVNPASAYIGTKLHHDVRTGRKFDDANADKTFAKDRGLSKIGENIMQKNEIREGWIPVDRALFGKRDVFYPESWEFRIKPADVEAIRNWSNIDENSPYSIDNVFNEIIKTCFSIYTPQGHKAWSALNIWDRMFIILTIREYTMTKGEHAVEWFDTCATCDNELKFKLDSQSLMYEMPIDEVMKYYDRETQTWHIDPAEYDFEDKDEIVLYLPTLQKSSIITNWIMTSQRQNPNKRIDEAFIRWLPWMSEKLSMDPNVADRQIRSLEMKFKSIDDADYFMFIDDIIRNITVMPMSTVYTICDKCGEEATSEIRFPDGLSSLFTVPSRHKKFGKK